MLNLIFREPVMAAIVTMVVALLGLLAAFGVTLTDLQTAAIAGFVVAVLALGAAVRAVVTPTRRS